MKVKYNNLETFHNIDEYTFVNIDRVRLTGEGALENTSGFDVYNDEETLIYLNSEHTVVYDKGENFVEYTKDQTVYYDFYVADSNGYVTGVQVYTSFDLPEGVTGVYFKSGQGKQFVEPAPAIVITDAEGYPNYKIVNDEIVEVTAEEKSAMRNADDKEAFDAAMESKLSELNGICAKNITDGVDVQGEHYSYGLEDQNNIKGAVDLATTTKLDVPYHADGQPCRLYTPEEITAIYIINETNLTHNITYANQLRLYTATLTTKEAVDSVIYGQPLEGDYAATYAMIMEQSKKIIAAFLGVDEGTVDAILGGSATMAAALN